MLNKILVMHIQILEELRDAARIDNDLEQAVELSKLITEAEIELEKLKVDEHV